MAAENPADEPNCQGLNPSEKNAWKLSWSDEFDYEGLPNPDKWSYDTGGHGWGNKELQYYTDSRTENARVENGRLIIEARNERWGNNPYTSARLVTKGKAAWTYGRFEIRAKLPSGRGSWPAIWLLPVDWNLGSNKWPDVGEIDIMEHVGHSIGTIHASAHSKAYQWPAGNHQTGTIEIKDATERFHTYSLEWTPKQIRGFVDDDPYFSYANQNTGWEAWPYQRDYYLLLNVAVGGLWGGAKGIDDNAFPQQMEVEYVRVYQPI